MLLLGLLASSVQQFTKFNSKLSALFNARLKDTIFIIKHGSGKRISRSKIFGIVSHSLLTECSADVRTHVT